MSHNKMCFAPIKSEKNLSPLRPQFFDFLTSINLRSSSKVSWIANRSYWSWDVIFWFLQSSERSPFQTSCRWTSASSFDHIISKVLSESWLEYDRTFFGARSCLVFAEAWSASSTRVSWALTFSVSNQAGLSWKLRGTLLFKVWHPVL